ncbi:MAG TPA: right-handed parallel beta-helix repeat-containing protein [Thermoanaerobaculia bacterium]
MLLDQTHARIEKNVIRGNQLSGIFTLGRSALYAYENTIEKNGRSGIYVSPQTTFAEILRNTIAENAQMGVAAAAGAQQVDIRENSMRANGGLGIDWNLDGVSPVVEDDSKAPSNAPLLFSAIYDPARNTTIVTGRVQNRPLGPYINATNVDLYANATPDGDGERWLQPSGVQQGSSFVIEIRGDLRGQWINATSTRTHWLASKPPADHLVSHSFAGGTSMTSELSNSVRVE